MVDIAIYKCHCENFNCEIRISADIPTIYCEERRAKIPVTEMERVDTIKRKKLIVIMTNKKLIRENEKRAEELLEKGNYDGAKLMAVFAYTLRQMDADDVRYYVTMSLLVFVLIGYIFKVAFDLNAIFGWW